ncbi:MAG: tyrosine recombinase XerC [Acutalibacteraceae bacterium]|nr:tyrosine recombinase XerC [Acutalibacteraceae bacterium]
MKYEVLYNSPDILRNFLTYSESIKVKSSLSVEEYYHDLTTFFRFLKILRGKVSKDLEFNEIPINDIDAEILKTVTLQDLHAFLVYCKNERNNSTTTRARKASTLRIYFKYLHSHLGVLESNPAALLETPTIKKTLPRHLTFEESVKLLECVDGPNKERDYCILVFFLNCGMRLSELCGINLTDINPDGALRLLGKGNKERIVYLNKACIDALNGYLRVRPIKDIPPNHANALFISRNKRRLSNKTVQHLVNTYLDKAGLSGRGFSTHKLRHTAATLMYQEGGVDIRVLKDILGHANLGTTQIYTHVADKQIENAINSNPLAKITKKDNDTH